MTQKYSLEYVKDFLYKNGGFQLLSEEYVDSKTPIIFSDTDEYVYELTFDSFCTSIRGGYKPYKFTTRNPFTILNIENWIRLEDKSFQLISDKFISSSDRNLIFYCNVCKKEWKTSWNDVSSGKECPSCLKTVGERKISYFLDNNNIRYIYQYKFSECKNILPLPFDFYLPDYNLCIEYQGEQHYKEHKFFKRYGGLKGLQERDKIKKDFCKKNEIKLITIPYTKINDINFILDNEFQKFT